MTEAIWWVVMLSPVTWLLVAWDVSRPRYYGDDGKVYKTALEAALAAHEGSEKETPK